MLKRFEGWTETLVKCLRLAPPGELVEWALRIHLPLTGWIDHRTVLLADAAHATLPHIAQGAAQAGEDAAVLSTLLAKCQTEADLPAALRAYERLRKPRADWAVEMARVTGTCPPARAEPLYGHPTESIALSTGENLHMADGAAQKARDEALRKAGTGAKSPDRWGDKDTQRRLYGLDVVAQADREYARL